jgi:hypothetical protein
MNALLFGLLLIAGFATAEAVRGKGATVARWTYAAALAFGAAEIARYDHGHPDWLLWIGYVGAPVVFIFGASAAGARAVWGWPDLGPTPARLAGTAGAVLLGVLAGTAMKDSDVAETLRRGDALADRVRAYEREHGGRRPATLADATAGAPPATAMGMLGPPPFRWADPFLSFPVGGGDELALDLSQPKERATWQAR